MQYFEKADTLYKMGGHLDRGFTLKKRFAANMCDSDNAQSVKNGIQVYTELWPLLFEGENMTMNYDMMEQYPR